MNSVDILRMRGEIPKQDLTFWPFVNEELIKVLFWSIED